MNNKSWYAFTVSVLIAMAWFVAMRTGAYAHWRPEYAQASPDVRNWFKSQRSPTTNVPCCDISDGEFAEEDIRYDEKGVGHFWTRWSKHLEWMLVPDDVVIQEPNKWGRPVVFWAEDSVNNVMYIRCYARGAGIEKEVPMKYLYGVHCSYRGCARTLPSKGWLKIGDNCYCGESCATRDNKLRGKEEILHMTFYEKLRTVRSSQP